MGEITTYVGIDAHKRELHVAMLIGVPLFILLAVLMALAVSLRQGTSVHQRV